MDPTVSCRTPRGRPAILGSLSILAVLPTHSADDRNCCNQVALFWLRSPGQNCYGYCPSLSFFFPPFPGLKDFVLFSRGVLDFMRSCSRATRLIVPPKPCTCHASVVKCHTVASSPMYVFVLLLHFLHICNAFISNHLSLRLCHYAEQFEERRPINVLATPRVSSNKCKNHMKEVFSVMSKTVEQSQTRSLRRRLRFNPLQNAMLSH